MQRPNLTPKKEISTRKFSYTYPKKTDFETQRKYLLYFSKKILALVQGKEIFPIEYNFP